MVLGNWEKYIIIKACLKFLMVVLAFFGNPRKSETGDNLKILNMEQHGYRWIELLKRNKETFT
jgi:hypothetical protein